jgi:hypothetical protein
MLWQMGHSHEMRKVWDWSMQLKPTSWDEFIKDNPVGSEGWINFMEIGGFYEMVGVLVKYKTINESMVLDAHNMVWDKLGPLVKGLQSAYGSPAILENYEYLAKRKENWRSKRKK